MTYRTRRQVSPSDLRAFAKGRGDASPAVVQLGEQLGRGSLVLASTELLDGPQCVADDARLLAEHLEVSCE